MELSSLEVGVLNSKHVLLMAETQDKLSIVRYVDKMNVSMEKSDCDGEVAHKTAVVALNKNDDADINRIFRSAATSTSKGVGNGEMTHEELNSHQAWNSDVPSLGYNSIIGSESENVFLPDISHTSSPDCSNFADISEINLCLNSILTCGEEETIAESSSPNRNISTDNNVYTVGPNYLSGAKLLKSKQDAFVGGRVDNLGNDHVSKNYNNIFDIVQFSECVDVQSFPRNARIQPQTITIESETHMVPTSALENYEISGSQGRQIT